MQERRRRRVWFLKETNAVKAVKRILCGPQLK
jgi:hypothetical protein